eukprot:s1913_g8.t1
MLGIQARSPFFAALNTWLQPALPCHGAPGSGQGANDFAKEVGSSSDFHATPDGDEEVPLLTLGAAKWLLGHEAQVPDQQGHAEGDAQAAEDLAPPASVPDQQGHAEGDAQAAEDLAPPASVPDQQGHAEGDAQAAEDLAPPASVPDQQGHADGDAQAAEDLAPPASETGGCELIPEDVKDPEPDDDEGTTTLMDLAVKQQNARKATREPKKKPPAHDAGAGKYAHCPSGIVKFCMPGLAEEALEPSDPYVEKLMALYSKEVQKNGFYLGLLDVAVMALDCQKEVLILYHTDEGGGKPQFRSLQAILQDMVAEHVDIGEPEPLASSKDTWIMACCRADFQKSSFLHLNHWVPVFSKSQIGDLLWDEVAGNAGRKITKAISRAHKRLQDQSSSNEEWSASLQEHCKLLTNKLDFLKMMHSMDFHPVEVPADGNCCAWSILSLMDGPVVRDQNSTLQDALGELWMTHSTNSSWQTLFLALGLQNELPQAAQQAASAEAETSVSHAAAPSAPQSLEMTPPKAKKVAQTEDEMLNMLSPVKTSVAPKKTVKGRPALFGVPVKEDGLLKSAKIEGKEVEPAEEKDELMLVEKDMVH